MAIKTSRSAREFMRRSGMLTTPPAVRPRLDPRRLRVNTIPLNQDQMNGTKMLDAAGDPPPDRGIADVWPPPQEVKADGS